MTSLRKNIAVIALVCLTGATAFAGKEGHGGNAVVCRDSVGRIKSAELLDLFEGRVIYRLKFQSSPLPIQLQLHGILNRLWAANKDMAAYMEPLFREIDANKTVLQDGVQLTPVDDAFPTVIPTDCKIEQLANYVNDQQILVDGEIWKMLDLTNQAALIVHESLYKFLRSFGETDSRRTRRIVAYLFSNYSFDDVYGGLPAQSQLCQSQFGEHYYKFFVYPVNVTDQNGVHQEPQAQFIWLDGQPQFSQKTTTIPTMDGTFPGDGEIQEGGGVTYTSFEKGDVIDWNFTPLDHGNIRTEISGVSGADPSRLYAKTKFSCQSYPASSSNPTPPQPGLSAVAVPTNPILIPYGTANVGGYFNLTGPYFIVNQLEILWAGAGGKVLLNSITLKSLDPNIKVSCNLVGDDLKELFPQNVSGGEVYFDQGSPAQASLQFGCELSGLPSPLPQTIDIPVEIEVAGSVEGPNGYMGAAYTTTTIHVN